MMVTNIEQMQHQQLQKALSPILMQLRGFVKNIVEDSVPNPNVYNMRIEISSNPAYIKFLLHNAEVNQIVGRAYELMAFLEALKTNPKDKKVEYDLNKTVKELIVFSQEKINKEVRWI